MYINHVNVTRERSSRSRLNTLANKCINVKWSFDTTKQIVRLQFYSMNKLITNYLLCWYIKNNYILIYSVCVFRINFKLNDKINNCPSFSYQYLKHLIASTNCRHRPIETTKSDLFNIRYV